MASNSWRKEKKAGNPSKLSHPLHANSLLCSLNEIRKDPDLCDGIVVVANVDIPVQRNILAAASSYFRALYSYELPFTSPEKKAYLELATELMTVEVFEQILDYIYTSTIQLSEDTIQAVLQASDVMLMGDLKDLCCEYLEQCISVSNCLGIRDFTEQFSCPRVNHAATQYLDEHFLAVSYSDEFLQLSEDKVQEILQRNSLVIQTEDAIFDCIMRWVRHDQESRKLSLEGLLRSCVHMALLDERYVQEHVIPDDLVRGLHLENLVLQQRRDIIETKQRGYTNIIVLTGGEGPLAAGADQEMVEIKKCVHCIPFPSSSDPKRTGQWIELCSMLHARIGHGQVEAGGCLYALGGRDNTGRILNSGEKFDPITNTWSEIAPMNHARVGFGLVTLEDNIYALGGSNDMSDPLTSVEVYNIYTNRWRSVPDMNLKRAWSACTVCSKKIFVVGGGVMGKLYEAVECYDPRSETWASVAPMKERRFDARAIGFGEDIFVFGGLRRLECPSAFGNVYGMKFCATEIYSTENKTWVAISKDNSFCLMSETCHIDAVTRCKDELVVIGDLDVGGCYHCIRAYSPFTNTWRAVIQNHPPCQKGMQGSMLKVPTSLIIDLMKGKSQK